MIACGAVLVAHLFAGALLLAPAPADEVVVGRPFPLLELPTIDLSRMLSLKEFRGQKVLLIEFASW